MGMPEFKDAEYDRKLEEYKRMKAKMRQAQQGNSSNEKN